MADSNRKDVELHIRATDQSSGALKSAAGNVDKVTRALKDQADQAKRTADAAAQSYNKLADQLYQAQQKALDSRKAFNDYYDQIAKLDEPTAKQVREFEKLGKAADGADKEVLRLSAALERSATAFDKQLASANKANQALGTVQTFTDAIQQAEAAQQRMAQLTAFRDLGAQAEQGAVNLDRFGQAAARSDSATAQFSRSLLSIIDPAASARATLEGLEAEVTRVIGVVGNGDKPIREYQDAIYDLGRIQRDIMAQGQMIDAFQAQQAAVERAEATFVQARQQVINYAQSVQAADEPNEQLAASLRQAQASLEAAGRELQQQQARLAQLKRPLDEAKISTDNLAQAQQRLQQAAGSTAGAMEKINKANAGTGRAGLFLGLKPYEIQNLGFQLNDIFVQLASGASVMQTFAQQGAQILQIFPGIFARIASFHPALLLVAAAAGIALASIMRILQLEGQVRHFSGLLTLNSDGLRYNAQELAATAKVLDNYGMSAKNATKALDAFVKAGVDASKLEEFGKTAQDVADITGKDVVEAARLMSEAFTGGADQIRKLDEEFNFLTASEWDHIEALIEDGKITEARTFAYERFQEVAQEGADKARSDWSVAARDLTAAWDSFLSTVANTEVIINTMRELDALIDLANKAISTLGRLGTAAQEAQNRATTQNGQQLLTNPGGIEGYLFGKYSPFQLARNLEARRNAPPPAPPARRARLAPRNPGPTQEQQKAADRLAATQERELETARGLTKEQRLQRAYQEGMAKAAKEGLSDEQARVVAFREQAIEQAKINKEDEKEAARASKRGAAAKRKSDAAARKAQREAEALARKIDSAEAALIRDMASMDVRVARQQKTSLEAQLGAIDDEYAKLFTKIEEYRTLGRKTIGGEDIAVYEARVRANMDLLKQQETLTFYEDTLKSLEQERAAALERINRQYENGMITAADAIQQADAAQADFGPQIRDMAAQAVAFAESISGASPSPELRRFIADMKNVRDEQGMSASTPNVGVKRGVLSREEAELNAILSERAALVEAINDNVEAGIITQRDGQAQAVAAYNAVLPRLKEQLAVVRATVESLRAQGVITETVYNTWLAKLALLEQQTQPVDENLASIKQSLEQGFTQGVVTAVDSIATSIGQAASGTISWADALQNVGNAFLQFAADFLRLIAQMIAQQAALNLLQAIGGMGGPAKNIMGIVKHDGGLVNGFGPTRSVSPYVFANAPRMHSGGLVGLAPNEYPAILKRNEEVLTEDNPRHMKNWVGGGSSEPPQIRIVNAIDPAEFLGKALGGRAGERAILNWMQANAGAVNSRLRR